MSHTGRPHKELRYALDVIQEGLHQALSKGQGSLMVQLVNEHRGFTPEAIEAIREELHRTRYPLPTLISILPAGRVTSKKHLYDGLQTIYCNSEAINAIYERMKKEPIRKGGGA